MIRIISSIAWASAALLTFQSSATAQAAFNDFDMPPHNYRKRDLSDPMSRLLQRVDSEKLDLGTTRGNPLVKKLLKELNISEDSQVMVFSRTSLQRRRVAPDNPRAMYFNEDVYLGWMPGGRIEIASMDPTLGGIFFYENQFDADGPKDQKISFDKPQSCLECHAGSPTNFLPGLLGRSIYPSSTGGLLSREITFDRIGHAIPIAERWGGWYVTGSPKGTIHRANRFAERGKNRSDVRMKDDRPLSTESLAAFFDEKKYLRKTSDMLTLMVFDHQIEGHDLLIEAHYKTRIAEFEAKENEGQIPEETNQDMLDIADKTVRYLLFKDEAAFPETGIAGDDAFKKDFLKTRKPAESGKSLKDFELKTRLFKFRCSYMIESNSFTGLPKRMKNMIYERLWKILSPARPPKGWEYLGKNERRSIIEIIAATKKAELPEYWKVHSDQ